MGNLSRLNIIQDEISTLYLTVFLFLSCGTESTPVYNLTTSVVGEGTITPSSGEYEEGEVVTLSASPSNGWSFSRWEGEWSAQSNPTSITMTKHYNVVGVFERRDYPLTITIEGEGTVNESIVTSPKTTNYSYETVIELTPKPSEGWRFVEWSGDLSGNEKPIQITISEEKNVNVKFSPIVFLGENGITIMCPDGNVGDIGIIDGLEYEVVDRELLIQMVEDGRGSLDRKVCVSLITDMSRLFEGLNFNNPIRDWDVSNVIDMSYMFNRTQFNQPIGEWDVRNVMDMSSMFSRTLFNQPIGNWDVSNVTYMFDMFHQSQFNQTIGNWDVSSVTNMSQMFERSRFNQNISNWCVSKIENYPMNFSFRSPLLPENHPIWGTCPD